MRDWSSDVCSSDLPRPLAAGAPRWKVVLQDAADRFNHGFERMSEAYARLTQRLVLRPLRMMATYAALIAATMGLFWATPAGFVPQQDQGYFLAAIFLPPGSSRSDERRVGKACVMRGRDRWSRSH